MHQGCDEAALTMARVLVGTSGWHYQSWRDRFFPTGLPLKYQLQYYSSQFATAELNSVFYRTPTSRAVEAWRGQTGSDFVFAWKASKFITHWKRLSPLSANSLSLLEERIGLLGPKAGPILFQLPPHFKADGDRLASFLKLLCKSRRYSFEFRHSSWYAPAVLRLLGNENIALCLSDHHDAPAPWEQTADFIYIRGHGPGGRYRGHYSAGKLAAWAARIAEWRQRNADVYVYFDNDHKSAAPADALKLRGLVDTTVSTTFRTVL
jgi:uncharacterized protein YecE (DUF72 family)